MRQLTSTRNGRLEEPPFPTFLRSWISDQRRLLQELVALSGGHVDSGSLQRLVERVTLHYEVYYKSKSTWAKRHVTSMFAPTWLEISHLWRPSLALQQLLHSQTRAEVVGDLGDLSQSQRSRLEAMQREVEVEEMEIADTLNAIRESTSTVGHVSEMMWAGLAVDQRMVTAHKEARQFRVLQAADELRMRTIKKLLEILTPIQCVHFLIAMAELQLRVHEWGQLRDTIIQARDVFGGGDGRALEA